MATPTTYASPTGPDDAPTCLDEGAPCRLEDDPRYCICSVCSARYRTPPHHVAGIILRTLVAKGFGDRLKIEAEGIG